MVRKLLVAAIITMFGLSAAAAQSCDDVIKKRQTLMKGSGTAGRLASSMIKGETPFDLTKAMQVLAAFAEDAKEMPDLFPDCSRTGAETTAAPKIWEQMDAFKAAIVHFAADVKAAQDSTKDLDTFKANIQTIGTNCSNCHQTFRIRKS
jgi:cytochrome c556